jgi:hypothetical protein
MLKAWAAGCADLRAAVLEWRRISSHDLPAFNTVLARHNRQPIATASPELPVPVCPAAGPTR